MAKTFYNLEATVEALRAPLGEIGFEEDFTLGPREPSRRYSMYRGWTQFLRAPLKVRCWAEIGEVLVAAYDGDDQLCVFGHDCPHDTGPVGGVNVMPRYTDETLECLVKRLRAWAA